MAGDFQYRGQLDGPGALASVSVMTPRGGRAAAGAVGAGATQTDVERIAEGIVDRLAEALTRTAAWNKLVAALDERDAVIAELEARISQAESQLETRNVYLAGLEARIDQLEAKTTIVGFEE